MTLMFKGVNLAQPKYMIPALVYLPLLFVGYMAVDMFNFKAPDKDNGLETTEYLNDKLPQANYKGDGIGGRQDAMLAEFGAVTDLTGVEDVGKDGPDQKEEYESHYTEDDIASLAETEEEREQMRRIQEQFDALSKGTADTGTSTQDSWWNNGTGSTASQGMANPPQNEEQSYASQQEEARKILEDEIARLRVEAHRKSAGEVAYDEEDDDFDEPSTASESRSRASQDVTQAQPDAAGTDPDAVHALDDDATSQAVKKAQRATTSTFHTIADAAKEPRLIKAIIDENIKAVQGSRVRLRILDDVEIGDVVLPKGSYLFATVGGFGSQRVRGSVNSLMLDDELVRINLTIYDMDGQEGLYVPESSFQEAAKDVLGGTVENNMTIESSGSSNNTLAQWGIQAAQNAYSKVSQALAKKIRKNSAKLKYGTFVYLVNGNNQQAKKK